METIKKARGSAQYRKFRDGKHLTRGEAIKAMCYDCLGGEGLLEDCQGTNCPLYQYYPSQYKKVSKKSPER